MNKQKQRPSFEFKEKEIFMDMIFGLLPKDKAIILRPHNYYRSIADNRRDPMSKHLLKVILESQEQFNRLKFEFIKYIKTLPKPEDRVMDFEYENEKGLPDFDKMRRLIEMRKTREEKSQEMQEELRIKKLCKDLGIKYNGILQD